MPIRNSRLALAMEVRVAIPMVAIRTFGAFVALRTLEALLVSLLALAGLILAFIGMSTSTEQQQACDSRRCNWCVHLGLLDLLLISRTEGR